MKQDNAAMSPYSLLSRYRRETMGVAILWVILYHAPIYIDQLAYKAIKVTGYGGVDIFLLLSGMGIYRSLQKNSVSRFLMNRLKRILPVWWGFLMIYLVVRGLCFHVHYSGSEVLSFATFTGFWLDHENQGDWYVYMIMLFYLISPTLFFLLKDSKRKRLTCAIMVIVAIIVSSAFFGQFKLIVFSRVPIYMIGMYFCADLTDRPMVRKDWIICLIVLLVGAVALGLAITKAPSLLWTYGLWWYPSILIAPALSLLISKLFLILEKPLSALYKLLRILGDSSLEILLATDLVFMHASSIDLGWISKKLSIVIAVFIAILFGILFHLSIHKVTTFLTKKSSL
ncbi:MAG: acyltransferase [Oscillospiraceae bacterium]|nr:acyltransferase [Oscillospiraceae bacterium]